MAVFLSPEWIADLDRALHDAPRPAFDASEPLVVEQLVHGAPTGDVTFHVVIDASGGSAHMGPSDDAHVRITTDFPTAVALLRGETNAQRALANGGMRIRGNLDVLARRAGELTAVTDVVDRVRVTTTIP